jgi:hypothetical protein
MRLSMIPTKHVFAEKHIAISFPQKSTSHDFWIDDEHRSIEIDLTYTLITLSFILYIFAWHSWSIKILNLIFLSCSIVYKSLRGL